MKTITAHVATSEHYLLGEGILWDARAEEVIWVDIQNGSVVRGTLIGESIHELANMHIDRTVGAVALADDGGLLVAGSRGLATIAPDGTVSHGPDLLGDRTNVRLNDGAVDPQGRFIVGSLALAEPTGTEELLRISSNGCVEVLRSGVSLSNGIAWSPDGETIYHVDTFARTVSSHAYHNNYWDPEAWTPVITAFAGYPDGLTVDSGGTLWVAVWGDGVVQQFAASGELLTVVEVETPLVSCAGFVGNGLDRLAITTSSEGATQCAGAIFVSDVHRTGIPESRWIGSTTHPYWLEEGGS